MTDVNVLRKQSVNFNLTKESYEDLCSRVSSYCGIVSRRDSLSDSYADLSLNGLNSALKQPGVHQNQEERRALLDSQLTRFFATELTRKLQPHEATKPTQSQTDCAVRKFLSTEERNELLNKRFCSDVFDRRHPDFDPKIVSLIYKAKERITKVLGPRPNMQRVIAGSWFGPGSTMESVKDKVDAAYKVYQIPYKISFALSEELETLYKLIWQNRQWRRALLEHRDLANYRKENAAEYRKVRSSREAFDFYSAVIFTDGGESSMVSIFKNETESRLIFKSDSIAVALQRGTGKEIARLSERVGLKKEMQERYHKELIRHASGLIGTTDLSSASDSVFLVLVRLLLPSKWYHWLTALRSETVLLPDGSEHTLQGYAGMGNATVFELETLIFWAIADSSCVIEDTIPQRDWFTPLCVSVYGDDIIASESNTPRIIDALQLFGFVINMKKTYYGSDAVRESCGAFSALTEPFPVFNIKELNTVPDVVSAQNRLFAISEKYHEMPSLSGFARSLALQLSDWLRKRWKVPEGPRGVDGMVWSESWKISQKSRRLHASLFRNRTPEWFIGPVKEGLGFYRGSGPVPYARSGEGFIAPDQVLMLDTLKYSPKEFKFAPKAVFACVMQSGLNHVVRRRGSGTIRSKMVTTMQSSIRNAYDSYLGAL